MLLNAQQTGHGTRETIAQRRHKQHRPSNGEARRTLRDMLPTCNPENVAARVAGVLNECQLPSPGRDIDQLGT
eukprot:10091831-Lingulodinium_polyedra.AAC.1